MKKLSKNIDGFFDRLDKCWRALPVRKQKRYTLYLFLGYFLMTTGIIVKVGYDMVGTKNEIRIEHIDSPILKKDNPAIQPDTLTTRINS